jgi:hypothetical protein
MRFNVIIPMTSIGEMDEDIIADCGITNLNVAFDIEGENLQDALTNSTAALSILNVQGESFYIGPEVDEEPATTIA